MKILLSIDDTDNQESLGTGNLAQSIAEAIETNKWGESSGVTRHQLYVHEDIPYTSHNSAMCFQVDTHENRLNRIMDFCRKVLHRDSAEGADPGLCMAVVDNIYNQDKLVDFGFRAKKTVLSKEDAYEMARSAGVHLSEHGGTGQGIVGALAGTGLRLNGNDGRFRGWYHLGEAGEEITVKELCSHEFIDVVRSGTGEILEQETSVLLGSDKIKSVMQGSEQVVLVTGTNEGSHKVIWKTLTKQQVKKY